MTPETIELLKKVHKILLNRHSVNTTAEFRTPAQSLRERADRIEYEEKTVRDFGTFMEQFYKTPDFN